MGIISEGLKLVALHKEKIHPSIEEKD